MRLRTKPQALAFSIVFLATGLLATAQQQPRARTARDTARYDGASLVVIGNIDWLQRSDVAALREGVLKSLELREGMFAKKGDVIGQLHDEIARLSAKKAKVAADSRGNIERSKAAELLAQSIMARDINLMKSKAISPEEVEKHKAELLVSAADVLRAEEEIKLAQAEAELADQVVKEHTITAPFDGIIINVMKREQESVRANEPVVTLGNPEVFRVTTFVPVDHAYRVEVGQEVLVRPYVAEADLPVEKTVYKGKVSMVDREVQVVAESAIRVFVEVPNLDGQLRPGLQAEVTIRLTPQTAADTSKTLQPTRTDTR
jgi:RND family efflux transporter MFP subunit